MIKTFLFLLLISLLVGCSKPTSLKVEQEVSSISLSGEKSATYTKKKDIAIFTEAVKNSNKIDGILNIAEENNLQFQLNYKDGATKTFLLWLKKDLNYGMIMEKEDSHTGYTLTEADVTKLIQLIFP